MIALKSVQLSFNPTKASFLQTRGFIKKKAFVLCLSKANGEANDEDSEAKPPEGDTKKQELLARIAMLQTQKVRLADYLDDRSSYLTQFAEEANAEIDKIGEDALEGLDEAANRIMGNIESRMQAFEESVELNKQKIEEDENILEEFEGQIENDKNEGMFFKNLGKTTTPVVDKKKAKEETEKIKDLTKETAGSKTRRNIYLALIALLGVGFVEGLVSSSTTDWRKVAGLGLILAGLFSQFICHRLQQVRIYWPEPSPSCPANLSPIQKRFNSVE